MSCKPVPSRTRSAKSADEMFKTKVLPVAKAHEDIFYASGAHKLSDEQIVELAHRMERIINL